MLHLLRSPCWTPSGGPAAALPATLPGCLLLYLAAQGGWVDREQVAAVFWPDDAGPQALHKLRVNLHRARGLLQGWACEPALRSERHRLWLDLPTDLMELQRTLASPDVAALLALSPAAWLQGFRIPGFGEFWDWADSQAAHWRRLWMPACEPALLQALGRGDVHQVAALFAAWQRAGGHQMPGVVGLDPQRLPVAAMALWQSLREQLTANRPIADMTTPVANGHGAAATRALRLPGRAREIEQLRASRAPALVLLGEPGAGKTSLLQAAHPGAVMLHGREGLAGVPFGPLLEWLHQQPLAELRRAFAAPAGGLPTGAFAANALTAYRLDLARLLPDLAPDEPLPPLDAHTAKSRLLEVLTRLMESRGAVLLIDDLQWCDLATLEWLAFVAHRGRQQWRASARPHELTPSVQRLIDSLGTAGLLAQQALPALDAPACAEVCRQLWPHSPWGAEVLERLHSASAGNPFVLRELVAAGIDHLPADGQAIALPRRVRELVLRRLRSLGAPARAIVDAAAVLVRPVSLEVLRAVADCADADAFVHGFEQALAAGELCSDERGVQCQHDLIRSAAESALSAARRPWLQRRAALALAAQTDVEPLIVAVHWQAAHEPQTALAWMQRGAQQQKDRGHFDQARSLWQRVADESADATQALRARLALAGCDLLVDLARGRQALEDVLRDAAAVADARQRTEIEGQALAALVDNAVFAGDLVRASVLALPLRELWPQLRTEDQLQACEALIELAMREPDIEAAWAWLAEMRRLAPQRPTVRSLQAQIHWFAGDVRAACTAFEALLADHPDHCRGLTIENDLAVMCHALGQQGRAETMARRSLHSWAGVPHTEALSLLVLGSVLTSAHRLDEAHAALNQALQLGQQQGSALFISQALVRRAQAWLQGDQLDAARADLQAAAPHLADSADPLRFSHYAVLQLQCQLAAGQAADAALLARLQTLAQRSNHPVVQARLAHIEALLAQARGDHAAAWHAAQRWQAVAAQAGLMEALDHSQQLLARLGDGAPG